MENTTFTAETEALRELSNQFLKSQSEILDFRYQNFVYVILEENQLSMASTRDGVSIKKTIPATCSNKWIFLISASSLYHTLESVFDKEITLKINKKDDEYKLFFVTNGRKYILNIISEKQLYSEQELKKMFSLKENKGKPKHRKVHSQKLKETLSHLSTIIPPKTVDKMDTRINYISVKFLNNAFSDFISTDTVKLGYKKLPMFEENTPSDPSPASLLIYKDHADSINNIIDTSQTFADVFIQEGKETRIKIVSGNSEAVVEESASSYFNLDNVFDYIKTYKNQTVVDTKTLYDTLKRITYFGKNNEVTLNIQKDKIIVSAFNSDLELAASEILPAETTFDESDSFVITLNGKDLLTIIKPITSLFLIIKFVLPTKSIVIYPSENTQLTSNDTFFMLAPLPTQPHLLPEDITNEEVMLNIIPPKKEESEQPEFDEFEEFDESELENYEKLDKPDETN